jgi:hypothetical protein
VSGWLPRGKGIGDRRHMGGCGQGFGVSSAVCPRALMNVGVWPWVPVKGTRSWRAGSNGVSRPLVRPCAIRTLPPPFRSCRAGPGMHRRHAARKAPPLRSIAQL